MVTQGPETRVSASDHWFGLVRNMKIVGKANKALAVLLFDKTIRDHLAVNEPLALRQAQQALTDTDYTMYLMKPLFVPIMTNIERLQSDFDGHLVYGTVNLFGADHHIRLVRVKEGDIVEPFDGVSQEVEQMFRDIINLNDGALVRCQVPGLPGMYVLVVYPFAD